MNVLILTPDAVGGTLLRNMLTIYMQHHDFDRPVIGLNDISLGLESYYSPEFNHVILKSENKYKDLPSLLNLLKDTDHYKVAKLTNYMFSKRNDPINHQIDFINYLNDNFFIISCRRENIFEHALSWSINKITNRLNVYSHADKMNLFTNILSDGINIDPMSLKHSLNNYKQYIQWVDKNFSIASYYYYEEQVTNIENYICNLPVLNGRGKKKNWKDIYNMSFNEYNKCHYYLSDVNFLLNNKDKLVDQNKNKNLINYSNAITEAWDSFYKKYTEVAGQDWPEIGSVEDYENLPESIKTECENFGITYFLELIYIYKNSSNGVYTPISNHLKDDGSNSHLLEMAYNSHGNFLKDNIIKYKDISDSIEKMKTFGILPSSIPIKKQTLKEKLNLITNIDQCIETYNNWIADNPDIGKEINIDSLLESATKENTFWQDDSNLQLVTNKNISGV